MSDHRLPYTVDLSNCDREPIHLLGHIQDFGILLAVSMDWMIQHVSINVADVLGRTPDELLGAPLSDAFPVATIAAVRERLQLLTPNEGSERIFGIDLVGTGRLFDLSVHISGASIVIEAEPSEHQPGRNTDTVVKSMLARVQRCTALPQLYNECVRQLRAVTSFDRVMLYKFAESGAGQVIAEAHTHGIESFLGLHYPATDIPSQARALYVKNPIRIIADVGSERVPVEPLRNPHGEPLDLSLSVLRAVSPIHIEYLKNMGVSASFSISVVIDGKLWGLFALHHYRPRRLSMEVRSSAELFGQIVGLIIEGRLATELREADEIARDLHDKVVGRLVSTAPSVDELIDFAQDFRDLIACDGFAVWANGAIRTVGACPSADEMPALARFLNRAASSRVYATDELSAVYPHATEFTASGAGLLAIPISRTPRDYLLFFRKEMIEHVTWAGNPAEKIAEYGPNGPRLSPRKSFEAWRETVRGKSAPWTLSQKKSGEALRVAILEVLLRFTEETARQRTLATQRQDLLIAELNHRVRNILGLMRALIAQSRAGAQTVDDFADIIGGRIQALARAHDQITDDSYAAQSLKRIIQTEVEAYVGQKAGRVNLIGPEVMVEARAFSPLALVFHEMVTNSAKYGALSDSSGVVDVTWGVDDNDCVAIDWRESNGPPVTPPTRRGFGSTIIERSIPYDLGGEVSLDYRLSGLRARFSLPPDLYRVSDEPAPARETAAATPRLARAEGNLEGLHGLIVEDNMIMALDADQLLTDNGMDAVFSAMSVADAKRILESERVDVALLDVNLGSETSFGLIGTLNTQEVPYVFVTGYGERLDLPDDARPSSAAIKKPYDAEAIVSAILEAVGSRPATD
ncbi:HWE histidine kinase domain-containing protein [Acuticoccus mangrovi]|uniref:Blue-light-activated histidine kinase n=1 Tax=Acuticoccus mangrovi TaxID=2796142 RepID=A0A934IHI3_9HYPH|nr:HWE histidine kinase domain-containing protein [Acuticoccus mangrovi]MBJ3775096.1 GAF domain-containing protein [Acuticoccus mangrovi]